MLKADIVFRVRREGFFALSRLSCDVLMAFIVFLSFLFGIA
jgi:hypothetical protein